jgi:hypothetical protein
MAAADSKPAIATNGTHEAVALDGNLTHDLSPAEYSEKKRYDPETLEIDYVAERQLVRKLDLFIVPPVMLLYLFVSLVLFLLTENATNQCMHA